MALVNESLDEFASRVSPYPNHASLATMLENAEEAPPQLHDLARGEARRRIRGGRGGLARLGARPLVPLRICAPQSRRRHRDAARCNRQARAGGASAATPVPGPDVERAHRDERGHRPGAARDGRDQSRQNQLLAATGGLDESSRRPRRRPRKSCRRPKKFRRWGGSCGRRGTGPALATRSTSAPPTYTSLSRHRTSPAEGLRPWSRRSASSSSALRARWTAGASRMSRSAG